MGIAKNLTSIARRAQRAYGLMRFEPRALNGPIRVAVVGTGKAGQFHGGLGIFGGFHFEVKAGRCHPGIHGRRVPSRPTAVRISPSTPIRLRQGADS